jgi:hypothetical protein
LGGAGHFHTAGQREIGIPLPPRSPHPTPQLIQLRQPKQMGAVDNQRVGPRNINARFNDVRGRIYYMDSDLQKKERKNEKITRFSIF